MVMVESARDIAGDFEEAADDEGKGEPGTVAEELDGEVDCNEEEEGSEGNCAGEGGIVIVENGLGVGSGGVRHDALVFWYQKNKIDVCYACPVDKKDMRCLDISNRDGDAAREETQ